MAVNVNYDQQLERKLAESLTITTKVTDTLILSETLTENLTVTVDDDQWQLQLTVTTASDRNFHSNSESNGHFNNDRNFNPKANPES